MALSAYFSADGDVGRPPARPFDGTDELTGLADRRSFTAALDEAVAAYGAGLAPAPILVLLDLDRFKAVNDAYGHQAGDALLRSAAGRMRAGVRQGDMVGRLGGDEFAILLPPPAGLAEATALGERLIGLLSRPFLVEGSVAQVGASMGIATLQEAQGASSRQLLRHADLALYAAKRAGRGRAAWFQPQMQEAAENRMQLEAELRAALPLGEFALFYQPLLSIAADRVLGFEALLRWQHPRRGMVSPAVFIGAIEEIGLMPAVGAWALRAGCRQAMEWPEPMSLSVNVSPTQLIAGDLPELVSAVLRETGLPAGRLELEVTESALVDAGNSDVVRQFTALRALGVQLALDDFGTGYASLSQLRKLPFSRMKLDRSFANDASMMQAALGIGRALGLGTTVEGIEQVSQLAKVRSAGCDMAQGYLIGRPLDQAATRAFISTMGASEKDPIA